MVPPPSLQHAAEWQSRVQVPSYLQQCADGATTFSSICSSVAEQGASPFPPAAVCRWCHHLSSTQHLLSGDVTPPEDQRSPSADQGFPQRTSGTSYEPVCANPNPAVACAPHRRPRHLCAALAASMRPSPPTCGPCRLHAALAAFMRPSPPSCGPPRLHAALAAFMRSSLLTSTYWPWPSGSAGAVSRGRPPKMSAAPSVQPAPS